MNGDADLASMMEANGVGAAGAGAGLNMDDMGSIMMNKPVKKFKKDEEG